MTIKSFVAIPAVLLALCAVPAYALDISVGGSAGGSASGSSGDSGFSAGFDASASASGTVDPGSDDNDDAGASASAGASGSASAGASGSVDTDSNDPLVDVMLLIRGNNWGNVSFSGLGDIDGETYDIDAWLNAENGAAFEQTVKAHADDIADLQASIAADADFSAWLDAENTDASAVVAVGVAADGSLAVFTRG